LLSASRHSAAVRIGPIVILLLGLAAILAATLGGGPVAARVLAVTWLPALIVAILLAALAVAVGWAFPWPAADPYAPDEEPLLPQSVLPSCRRKSPLIALHALEPGAGSTTLAFNLAVGAAVQGTEQRRPLALLRAGELTQRLGLHPAPLSSYLVAHPVSVDDSLVELASRNFSGCELLCFADGDLNGQRLRLMRPVLRRFYDLIVLDCPTDDRWLTDVAVEVSDLMLLVAQPTASSASQAAGWADRAWDRGLEGKIALWLNRVEAHRRLPDPVLGEFRHQAWMPADPVLGEADRQGLPWVLRWESAARPLLQGALAQLLPTSKAEAGDAG
jgi:Flp pilus assembly CpaE family ATPase